VKGFELVESKASCFAVSEGGTGKGVCGVIDPISDPIDGDERK
jgi:hypothetical protein